MGDPTRRGRDPVLRDGSAPAIGPSTALAAMLVVLVATNLLNNWLAKPAYLVTSLVATAALLGLFRVAGCTWADAGLSRDRLARGAGWALVLVGLVAAGYLAAALLPSTREAFLDRRVQYAGIGAVVYQMLLRIPFGTVLLEEVAFRGVLYGLLRSGAGTWWATAVSCALFGLWHVLPALDLIRLNPVAGRVAGGHLAIGVMAAVAASAVGGLVLCEVRRRSGSLVAAMGLHWATNALGYLTAVLLGPR